MEAIEFIKSITSDEMEFISKLDYGDGSEKHCQALEKVIFEQGGVIHDDQRWYPYEVIELGANWLQQGHEKEFSICTLLVIMNVQAETDTWTELDWKLESQNNEYKKLPKEMLEIIREQFARAGC